MVQGSSRYKLRHFATPGSLGDDGDDGDEGPRRDKDDDGNDDGNKGAFRARDAAIPRQTMMVTGH